MLQIKLVHLGVLPKQSLKWVWVGPRLMAVVLLCIAFEWSVVGEAYIPREPADQPWQITNFTKDSGLSGKNLLDIAFQGDFKSRRIEKVWVASSDGLGAYDGYSWKRFRVSDGLPSDFVRCVLVDRAGQLWVGSDRGAGLFDGNTYRSFGSETNLAGLNVRRIVEDPDGTLWFCCDSWPNSKQSGGLTSFRAGRWQTFSSSDGLPSDYVTDYLRDSAGRQFVITLKGVAERNGDRWVPLRAEVKGTIVPLIAESAVETPGLGVVFSDGREIFSYRQGAWRPESGSRRHDYGLCATSDGRLLGAVSLGQGRKAFADRIGEEWRVVSATFNSASGYLEELHESPDGSVWSVGFDCLVCWRRKNSPWSEFEGVPKPQLVDGQGTIWFGHFNPMDPTSGKLVRYFRDGTWDRMEISCSGLTSQPDGSVWGWSTNRIFHWRVGGQESFDESQTGLRRVDWLEPDRDGGLWVLGADSNSIPLLVRSDAGRWRSRPIPEFAQALEMKALAGGSNSCWLMMRFPEAPTVRCAYVRPGDTGLRLTPVPEDYISLFSNGTASDPSGRTLWLFGESGLFRLREETRNWESITNMPGRAIYGAVEREDGTWFVCAATLGGTSGLARLSGERWSFFPIETQFDLSRAADGTLLVSGKGHFTIVPNQPDIELIRVTLPTDQPVRSEVKDTLGNYWVGTEDGVFRFRPERSPPEVRVLAAETNLLSGQAIRLTAYGIERWAPIGTMPDFRFSWRLDGGPWSPFDATSLINIPTKGLPNGEHHLELRGEDSGLALKSPSLGWDFQIYPVPLQNRAWFVPMAGGMVCMFGVLSFIALHARSRLSRHAIILEGCVKERTLELEEDIRQRKQAEAALRLSEERLVTVVEHLSEGIVISDFKGRLIHWNAAAIQMHGFSPKEDLHRPLSDMGELFQLYTLDGSSLPVEDWPMARILRGATLRNLKIRVRRRDIHLDRIVSYSGAAVRSAAGETIAFVSIYDITERRRTERRLATQQAVSAVLAEASSLQEAISRVLRTVCESEGIDFGIVWELGAQGGGLRCVDVWKHSGFQDPGLDPAIRASVDVRQAGPVGRAWAEARPVVVSEPELGACHPFASLVQAAGLRSSIAFPILFNGAVTGVVELLGRETPVGDVHQMEVFEAIGRQLGVFTDRRRAEERAVVLEQQLNQAQKMEAIGQLSGGIAHDFNNILGAILGNAQLAGMEEGLPAGCRVCLDEIMSAGNRAKKLVQQILTFSRRQVPERRMMSLVPVVDECVSMVRATLPAGVKLVVSRVGEVPQILGDPTQIHQMLLNLCTNAWHAMEGRPGNLEILLEGRTLEADEAAALGTIRPGRCAVLAVIDNGKGMDAQTLERAFEPFFTTKKAGEGTGLGLAVVHGIVRSHDGAIRVQSRPGQGTRVLVYLPGASTETEPDDRTIPSGMPTGRGQRVLYLDDEQPLVFLATRALRGLGFDVVGCTRAAEALNLCRQDPTRFEAVVTDLNMPGQSGLEVAEQILQVCPNLPIVLSTGYITEDLRKAAARIGIRSILFKPNSIEELGRTLHQVLDTPSEHEREKDDSPRG